MLRTRLPNIFLKEKSFEPKKAYNKQCNICVSMLKKAKQEDDKTFCTTVSLLFGNKEKSNHKTNLIEKNVLVTSDEKITKKFKENFDEIVAKLNIIQSKCYIWKAGNIEHPVKKGSVKYECHPSITISKTLQNQKIFILSVSSLFQQTNWKI